MDTLTRIESMPKKTAEDVRNVLIVYHFYKASDVKRFWHNREWFRQNMKKDTSFKRYVDFASQPALSFLDGMKETDEIFVQAKEKLIAYIENAIQKKSENI